MILNTAQTYYPISFSAAKPKMPAKISQNIISKNELENYLCEGKNYKEIGKIFSKPAYWVRYQAVSMNIKSQPQRTREKLEKVIPTYIERGMTMKEMSEKTGIDASTIAKYIKATHDKKPVDVRRDIAENLFRQNLSDQEIALRLDLGKSNVNAMRHKYGFSQDIVKEKKLETRKNQINEKLENGLCLVEIAEDLKLSKKSITKFMKEHMKIEDVKQFMKETRTNLVRKKYANGAALEDIAKEMKISENTVKKILNQ